MTIVNKLVWGLTRQSGNHFSWALGPAEPDLWMCCLWSWLYGFLMCVEANHWVCCFWRFLGGASLQAKVRCHLCLLGASWKGLQSDLRLIATCRCLERLSCKPRPASTLPGLRPCCGPHNMN